MRRWVQSAGVDPPNTPSSEGSCGQRSGIRLTYHSGEERLINSIPARASQRAVRPDALAWSRIDSCLTSGQHGRRHRSCRLVPEPSVNPVRLASDWTAHGRRRLPGPCCCGSLVIPVTPHRMGNNLFTIPAPEAATIHPQPVRLLTNVLVVAPRWPVAAKPVSPSPTAD